MKRSQLLSSDFSKDISYAFEVTYKERYLVQCEVRSYGKSAISTVLKHYCSFIGILGKFLTVGNEAVGNLVAGN
jgi:hypothetical protein